MNEIYIIRHAAAADPDKMNSEESYRYLTIHGRNHCKVVAQRMRDMKIEFDLMISSPVVRAVQTAEVFASVMKFNGEIRTAVELIGGNPFTKFLNMLKNHSHFNKIAIIGHAPDVNNFCSGLIKNQDIKNMVINFKNTSVCRIDYDLENENGRLVWFLNSENMKLNETG